MKVIDAGHGGSDSGASGNGIVEKDYALLISQYMADRFRQLGIPVAITRTTDETLTPEERVSRVLEAFGNKPDVVVISNHLNAGGGEGAEIIYALRNKDTLSRTIAEEIAKTGQTVRKWYQRRLPSDTSKDYYFIHRETGVTEPVIVEYGFVDNATDAAFIKNNWRSLAEAVVRAATLYQGIPYLPVAEEGTYIVQKGDTLWSIAKKFNVGVTDLKNANNLTTNTISVGQVLKIPGFAPPSQTTTTYVVQKGDSLWNIASVYGTTVDAIKSANNLTSNTLSIGQVLKIPSTGPIAPPVVPPVPSQIYTVQRGDSLWSIAQKFGIAVNDLREANDLTSDVLSIGQTLVIPEISQPTEPTVPVQPSQSAYTVQPGDTLWSIANKYGVSVTEIRNLNNLTSDVLTVGQVLNIPVTEPAPPITGTTYTVRSGDNLYSIASRFGVTVDAIRTANDLTSDILSVGQQLIIPTPTTPAPEYTFYTVQPGDSLYSIATRYNTTPQDIMQVNNLTSTLLSVGQQLKIPTAAGTAGQTYTVGSGDSLYSIASRFGVTVSELRAANNLTSDILHIGQVLVIP